MAYGIQDIQIIYNQSIISYIEKNNNLEYYKSQRDMIPYIWPSKIIKYFNDEPHKVLQKIDMKKGVGYPVPDYSLSDYLHTIPRKFTMDPKLNSKYHNGIIRMAQKLVNEGLLIPVGDKTGVYQKYRGTSYDPHKLEYGYYDFMIFGFPDIAKHFDEAVRPVIIKYKTNGDSDIGTSFTILYNYKKQYLITARHCLPEDSVITINPFLPNEPTIPQKIFVPTDDRIDVAVLEFSDKLLLSNKFFHLDVPYLLDSVMSVGYPPIQGIADAIQIQSTGAITAITETYWHNEEQLLISTRVKGGNSGGPVINEFGYVVGMATDTLLDPKDNSKPDALGFAFALSSKILTKILDAINEKNDFKFKELEITKEENGFSVK